MRAEYSHIPSGFFLIHPVIARILGGGWLSAHMAVKVSLLDVGRVHPQRLKLVREMLQQYVEAGIPEHNDQIAACPFYSHRAVTLDQAEVVTEPAGPFEMVVV